MCVRMVSAENEHPGVSCTPFPSHLQNQKRKGMPGAFNAHIKVQGTETCKLKGETQGENTW